MSGADRRRAALVSGQLAEQVVADRLVAGGARVLARNWSGGGGELDLVAIREGRLRFVEVKARSNQELDPLDQITPAKQRRLRGAAEAWLRAHHVEHTETAFLVAVVDLSSEPWQVAWVDDAFDGT